MLSFIRKGRGLIQKCPWSHHKASAMVSNSACTEVDTDSAGRAQAATADGLLAPSPGSSFTERLERLVCKISSLVIFVGTFNTQKLGDNLLTLFFFCHMLMYCLNLCMVLIHAYC